MGRISLRTSPCLQLSHTAAAQPATQLQLSHTVAASHTDATHAQALLTSVLPFWLCFFTLAVFHHLLCDFCRPSVLPAFPILHTQRTSARTLRAWEQAGRPWESKGTEEELGFVESSMAISTGESFVLLDTLHQHGCRTSGQGCSHMQCGSFPLLGFQDIDVKVEGRGVPEAFAVASTQSTHTP